MSLILDGTNGVSDIDGTAATPAIRGTDTNTGIFFPAADTIAFSEGGTEVARFDSAGNLGIGTASPNARLQVTSSSFPVLKVADNLGGGALALGDSTISSNYVGAWRGAANSISGGGFLNVQGNGIAFMSSDNIFGSGSERMRIDSSGALLIGTTSAYSANYRVSLAPISTGGIVFKNSSTSAHYPLNMLNSSGSSVGYIEASNTAVSYVSASDYRLKENIAPMTGALDKVSALKPVTYNWKIDGSSGQGFIAHELQAVVPDCVTGEKDAVDEEGNPQYQGIDTSFLVATLTAAIQELKAELDTVKAELASLKA
jgi:hypothetical protein